MIPADPPRPPVRAADACAYFLIAALLDATAGLRSNAGVLHGILIDPDSYMRLDRLHDILAHHAPLHVVLRDASGAGAVLHWSHLLDMLLLLLALPLRPFLDQAEALYVAAAMLGPLSVGLLGTASAWAMAPNADRRWRWMAPVLTALSPSIVNYGQPGVATHHILLATAAVVMAGAAGRACIGDHAADVRLGACAGAAIWLSPEAMPFVLMAFGGLGLAWMLTQSSRAPARFATSRAPGTAMAIGCSVFLVVVACAFATDPPFGGYGAVEIARLSVVYLVLGAMLCAIGWTLWGIDRARFPPRGRIAVATAATLACLGFWLALFPAVLKGPDGLMDPATTQIFSGNILEMRPVWSLGLALALLPNGVLAALLLAWFSRHRHSPLWAYAAVCVSTMLVLGSLHVRFVIYGEAAAAVTLPAMLTELTMLLARRRAAIQAASRIGLIALMLLPDSAYAASGWQAEDGGPATKVADCPVGGLGPMFAPYAGQVVLADVNAGPELLYRTGILIVGSAYFRNIDGFMRLRAAWLSTPSATEPEAVRDTKASLVLACTHTGATAPGVDAPAAALFERLALGDVPPWLAEVARDRASGNVLYRIVPPASATVTTP
jgi:hypothetical protein